MEFIHITDLHFEADNSFQAALIEALLKDVALAKSKGLSADLIVFSGDLVNNPDDENVYSKLDDAFLSPLLRILEIPNSRVVLCPGNHDVSFTAIKQRKMVYDTLQSQGKEQSYLSTQCKSSEFSEYAVSLSRAFFDFSNKYGGKWENPFAKLYDFDELNLSIACINTAFSCSLEGSLNDRGKLAFPADIVLQTFQQAQSHRRVLSAGHHTLSDFNEQTSRIITPFIEKRSHIHMFGHVHQPKPLALRGSVGNCFFVQGGALYETKGEYNGYSIIRLSDDDAAHIEVEYHTYYVDRQEFDIGTNVVKEGKFFNTDKAYEYYQKKFDHPVTIL